MSHHYAGPDFGFPHGDARLNLTDLYAFPKPGSADRSIVVMNVHPGVSLVPPGPTTDEPFSADAIYELKIDTDGDAVANISYQIRFSSAKGWALNATLTRLEGAQAAGMGEGGKVIIDPAPVSTGPSARVTEAGDHRFFAGWRSDPFFFDTLGAVNNLQFTGTDFFTMGDVCSIVLDIPNAALGTGAMSLWHRTLEKVDGRWVQADRAARPSQGVFLTGDEKPAYLTGEPTDDARFVPVFAHSLEHIGGYSPEEAKQVAASLLPDVLRYDPRQPASYPANGRTLTDDVMDVFLPLITNGKVPTDRVGPHTDLLVEFPYLGPPHRIRTEA